MLAIAFLILPLEFVFTMCINQGLQETDGICLWNNCRELITEAFYDVGQGII